MHTLMASIAYSTSSQVSIQRLQSNERNLHTLEQSTFGRECVYTTVYKVICEHSNTNKSGQRVLPYSERVKNIFCEYYEEGIEMERGWKCEFVQET